MAGRQVLINQVDIMVADKGQKTLVVIDVEMPSESNIREKEYEKLEKLCGLKVELERMCNVKVKMVPVMAGTLRAATQLKEWLQQISGTTLELSVQKSELL